MKSADQILAEVSDYYQAKLREHGAAPRGVDWNSAESQQLRFAQLLRVVSPASAASRFTLLDYGCGYGALLDTLRGTGLPVDYLGYDIAPTMIAQAHADHAQPLPPVTAQFTSDVASLPRCDFVVASGIFNVKLTTAASDWRDYVLETIEKLASLAARGFAFNMLTSYSDADRMRADLFYGDPTFFFDHCKRKYSRNVALLHDYDLYEFTIIVRR